MLPKSTFRLITWITLFILYTLLFVAFTQFMFTQ